MDHNGTVNALDALLLMRCVMQLVGEDALYLDVADYNGDGQVNALDALAIMRTSMGLR